MEIILNSTQPRAITYTNAVVVVVVLVVVVAVTLVTTLSVTQLSISHTLLVQAPEVSQRICICKTSSTRFLHPKEKREQLINYI